MQLDQAKRPGQESDAGSDSLYELIAFELGESQRALYLLACGSDTGQWSPWPSSDNARFTLGPNMC